MNRSPPHLAFSPWGAAALVLAAALAGYVALRACCLSFTWDEAYSYLQFARRGIVLPVPDPEQSAHTPYDRMSANNHPLNTALMILCERIGGPREWALRLPNVLVFILFLFYAGRLARTTAWSGPAVLVFLLMVAHPYLLDFFSLARGYGLAWAFTMASLYHLRRFLEGPDSAFHGVWSTLWAALAAIAHLTLLLHLVILAGLVAIVHLLQACRAEATRARRLRVAARRSGASVLVAALALSFLVPFASQLQAADAFFYGGHTGFWKDTVQSLVERMLYGRPYAARAIPWVSAAVILGLVLALARNLLAARRNRDANARFVLALLSLAVLESLASVAQHRILGTLFLQGRAAMFLFLIVMVLLGSWLRAESARSRIARAALAVLAVALMVHFGFCANASYVYDWKFDADTRRMLADLEAASPTPPGDLPNVMLGTPLWFVPSVNYYRVIRRLDWLNAAEALETASPLHEYFYLDPATAQAMDTNSMTVLRVYPLTGNILARPAQAPQAVRTIARAVLDFEEEDPAGPRITRERAFRGEASCHLAPSTEFGPAFRHELMTRGSLKAGFSLWVFAPNPRRADLLMLLTLENEKGVYWRCVTTTLDFVGASPAWKRAHLTGLLPPEAAPGDILSAYLWNPRRHEVFVDEMAFVLVRYDF